MTRLCSDFMEKLSFRGKTIDLTEEKLAKEQCQSSPKCKAKNLSLLPRDKRVQYIQSQIKESSQSKKAKKVSKRQVVKKHVQFNQFSTLYVYRPNTAENLHYTEDERVGLKENTAFTVNAIRKTLQYFPSSYEKMRRDDSISEADPFLTALEEGKNGAQAEEIIGVEHMIHGKEYDTKRRKEKRKIPVIVVREWHKLRILQAVIESTNNENSGRDGSEEVCELLATFYSSLAKDAALRARRRAEYIHRLNEASVKMPPAA